MLESQAARAPDEIFVCNGESEKLDELVVLDCTKVKKFISGQIARVAVVFCKKSPCQNLIDAYLQGQSHHPTI